MHLEISIGTHFLISYLYNKLPRRSIDLLYENLIKNLTSRYKNHWYTKTPLKGTAYRCIKLPIDPIIKTSAIESNIILNELIVLLPDLNLWIDPGEVCYNLNDDENNIVVIWNNKINNIEKIFQIGTNNNNNNNNSINNNNSKDINDENELNFSKFIENNNNNNHPNKLELLEHLLPSMMAAAEQQQQQQQQLQSSVTLIKQPLVPQLITTASQQQQQQQQNIGGGKTTTNGVGVGVGVTPLSSSSNLMTTAAFAQTKFGSTKLKINNNKKLLRQQMSPIEFSNYIKSKQQQQLIGKLENIWGGGGGRMETSLHCNL